MSDDPHRLDALGAAVTLLRRVADPRERLRAIALVRAELTERPNRLDSITATTLHELRSQTPTPTWAELGALLGVTHQRAQQLAQLERTLTP